ncbi:recombinase (plasmid) [Alkalihalophilus pseudofirmus OF4]|uniref:Recombinase n=1 Tax=Alkalihalophilus pseudofirmus (strain ATCC BAA-2126 / JCM 17055 / OF4) TaxID=398511 RepID=D3G217_ALKPO|nr:MULTISPECIES: recombinase family protein [Alkalihalophilus]ADC52393.1 recombinase [Alkalihalophilus pseudofirmus OF4]MED1603431.1 recombinase family protein [Alkalihalophilus marmarensis]
MTYIGYARVSSEGQNMARQIKELEEFGCEIIYQDTKSGKDFDREGFQKMKRKIREKDVLVVHDLSRLGRNAKEIKKEWEEIREEGADIVVRNMPILDTRNEGQIPGVGELISNLVLTLLSWMVEEERNRIRTAQREGIEIAKEQGKYTGRKVRYHEGAKGADKLVYDQIVKMLSIGHSVMEVHRKTEVSRNTIYKIKRTLEKG